MWVLFNFFPGNFLESVSLGMYLRDEDGLEIMLRPTRNTADAAKSHLKKGIKLLSNGKLDIGDFDEFEVKE